MICAPWLFFVKKPPPPPPPILEHRCSLIVYFYLRKLIFSGLVQFKVILYDLPK